MIAAVDRWWLRCAAAATVGVAVTLAVALDPLLSISYRAPTLRAVLETGIAIIGSLVSFLVLGRYRRSHRSVDLAIAVALAILALSGPVFIALPAVVLRERLEHVGDWSFLGARVCTAALLWWASGRLGAPRPATPASVGPRATERPTRRNRPPIAALSVLALASVMLLVFFRYEPGGGLEVMRSGLPHPFADPGVSAVQLGCFLLFAGASARFALPPASGDDRLLGWLSLGCACIAIASLDYGLFPTTNRSELHLGDIFRAGAVLVFAIGSAAEIRSYWDQTRCVARLEERRAVARELHDGLAQELAFLSSHVRVRALSAADDEWFCQLAAATERALAESRRAIAALIAESRPSLGGDLEREIRQIASDGGAQVELHIQPSRLDPVSREVVIRIVREAVINAVRHGHARLIRVDLGDESHPVLRVVDDGVGFDPSKDASSGRFGIVTMRERAQSIGARFDLRSVPGSGTTVELSWALSSPNAS
jgi:signal transduction histidine kinase